MITKGLDYTWCEECLGCEGMLNRKFQPALKTVDKPDCFAEGYTKEEKVKKLRERKDLDVYGSMHGNNN